MPFPGKKSTFACILGKYYVVCDVCVYVCVCACVFLCLCVCVLCMRVTCVSVSVCVFERMCVRVSQGWIRI